MLKILTNIRTAGHLCHFVVGWFIITICQFVDVFRLQSKRAFFLKTGRFDSSLFDSNSSDESLMNHFNRNDLHRNDFVSKRL